MFTAHALLGLCVGLTSPLWFVFGLEDTKDQRGFPAEAGPPLHFDHCRHRQRKCHSYPGPITAESHCPLAE